MQEGLAGNVALWAAAMTGLVIGIAILLVVIYMIGLDVYYRFFEGRGRSDCSQRRQVSCISQEGGCAGRRDDLARLSVGTRVGQALLGFIYIYFAVMVVALIAVVFGGIMISAIVLAAKF